MLPFSDRLIHVLDRALLLKAREGYQFAGAILNNLLRSLTTIYPTDYRSIAEGYDRPLSEYLPIRDWGKPGDMNNLKINWHFPCKEERVVAEKIMERYLEVNLKKLHDHVDQVNILSREALQRTLSHTLDCILGAGAVLPPWHEELSAVESSVTLTLPLQFSHSDAENWQICFPNGKHIRLTVAQTVISLFKFSHCLFIDEHQSIFSPSYPKSYVIFFLLDPTIRSLCSVPFPSFRCYCFTTGS